MDIYAVAGRPVLHSKSPQMHNSAFGETLLDAHYTRISANSAKEAISAAQSLGVKGMNITTPLKDDFFNVCTELDKNARAASSVNCVTILDGAVLGYNTDVYGVHGALEGANVKIKDANACVIGSGGAARSAALALLEKGATVTILNRTKEKAQAAAKKLGCSFAGLTKPELESIIPKVQIIVSATSAAQQIISPEFLQKGQVVLDANYSAQSTLLEDAKKRGCKTIDGIEWLLHQGAKSFEIFTGKSAPLDVMRAAAVAKSGTKKSNIVLTGFMGAGKSSVCSELSKIMGLECDDIDSRIEQSENMSVKEVFSKMGESKFRELERVQALLASRGKNKVIACGGGTIVNLHSAAALREHGITVLLCANMDTIMKRVGGTAQRPLLNRNDMRGSAQNILERRMDFYVRSADLVVCTDDKTPKEAAEVIALETNKTIKG